MKIALVGCGSIGAIIAQAISDGKLDVELKYVYDSIEEKGKEFEPKKKPEREKGLCYACQLPFSILP